MSRNIVRVAGFDKKAMGEDFEDIEAKCPNCGPVQVMFIPDSITFCPKCKKALTPEQLFGPAPLTEEEQFFGRQ
jgi:ribosomal protein S27E